MRLVLVVLPCYLFAHARLWFGWECTRDRVGGGLVWWSAGGGLVGSGGAPFLLPAVQPINEAGYEEGTELPVVVSPLSHCYRAFIHFHRLQLSEDLLGLIEFLLKLTQLPFIPGAYRIGIAD